MTQDVLGNKLETTISELGSRLSMEAEQFWLVYFIS